MADCLDTYGVYGFELELWIQPGKPSSQGKNLLGGGEGGLAVVLAAGNHSYIGLMDALVPPAPAKATAPSFSYSSLALNASLFTSFALYQARRLGAFYASPSTRLLVSRFPSGPATPEQQ
jgi:hypothetical protein